MPPHIVIAGGGFAALSAAHRLAPLVRRGRCRVTLVSAEPDFVYLPSLPWVAVGRAAGKAITRPLGRARRARFSEVRIDTVSEIDPERKIVRTTGGALRYDLLILAVGTRPDAAVIPGYAGYAYGIESLPDAHRLRERLRGGARRVVIATHQSSSCVSGMHELAFLLARAGLQVRVVTTGPALGADFENSALAGAWGRAARRAGIRLHDGRTVAEIGRRGVLLDDGTELDCDLAVVSPPPCGSEVMRSLSPAVTRTGLLLTRPTLASIRWNTVYGAGDVVALSPPSTGQLAEQMGTVAADNAAAALELRPGPLKPFAPHSLTLHDLGRGRGIVHYRRPAPGFGPPRMRWLTAGWPLGYGKLLFRRFHLAWRV